jgi:3-oxoadipate enol-lactonase/4-carboxymuconolactone decarboxylase
MIAMELALRRPERVAGLALICTSALMDKAAWSDRIARVRSEGMASIVDLAMGRFLSPGFARTHRGVADGLRRRLTGAAPEGYAGCGCAIRDMNLLPRLGALEAPTLVVGGDKDVSTPFADHGARLVEAIPGATAAHVNTGHLAPIEAPDKVAELLVGFFSPQPERTKAMDSLFEAGLANRRRVLGDAWVDQSLAKATPFTADFQAMITRTAWNEIWGRAGLDDRTRRLIVVAITASLGRWEEFALHVQAGLARGGFSQEELKEVLMQTAVYAGVPAANTGFREAGRIIAELDDGD